MKDNLAKMLNIEWRRGPDLPQGFQDSDVGFIGNYLITVCGFCQGHKNPTMKNEPERYPRGFLKKVWALDVSSENSSWISLPDFPGDARQGLMCTAIGNSLYCWGGFSYTKPFCYSDGYRLQMKDNKWVWEELPNLPWPLTFAGICSVGSIIYLSGGKDYDNEHSYCWSDRFQKVERMGAKLLAFDSQNISEGWKVISEIPGVPRNGHVMAVIGSNIYIITGVTGHDWSGVVDTTGITGGTVVDNWRYDLSTGKWTRLPDTPIATAGFPDNKMVFKDRYILLIGGYQFQSIINIDQTSRENYGKVSLFNDEGDYCNDVLVYDSYKNIFGRADYLPLNNFCPGAVIRGNELYLIGGETGGSIIEGKVYGHHPDLCLIGKISE